MEINVTANATAIRSSLTVIRINLCLTSKSKSNNIY